MTTLFSGDLNKPDSSQSSVLDHVTMFQYQPLLRSVPASEPDEADEEQAPEIRLSEEIFAQRLAQERARGVAETETRLEGEIKQQLQDARARISDSLRSFEKTRQEYFVKVEGEVVQLALSIARKILHREAQVDPLLLTALVQVALAQIKEGSAVTVKVRPEEANRWREQLHAPAGDGTVVIVEDVACRPGDCLVETEMGHVNFSLEAQLKEVEKGFLDVLARTPQL